MAHWAGPGQGEKEVPVRNETSAINFVWRAPKKLIVTTSVYYRANTLCHLLKIIEVILTYTEVTDKCCCRSLCTFTVAQ